MAAAHTRSNSPTPHNPKRRRALLLGMGAAVAVAALAYALYWNAFLRHYESTDNAYVQAPLVLVTPQVGGTVIEVLADDTDTVKAGQPLVRLDPADARLALQRARATLAQTVREVRTLYTSNGSFDAQIRLRRAEVERVRAELARAGDAAARRAPLVDSGAVSAEEMKHAESTLIAARSTLAAAQSALAAAEQQALGNQALTDGTRIDQHPNVQRAAAALREAWLELQRTELVAPLPGQVARRTVQIGQRVAAGAPLMSVIVLEQLWVEANFKEVQLRRMHIGQPVRLVADLYGDQVEYRGRIAGLGAGTGSAFALLPAQNATGNWIKVVQRVPVRIEIDRTMLAEHPLRVGLSMRATVDLGANGGAPLSVAAAAPRTSASAAGASAPAAPADAADQQVEQMVRDIIRANLGKARR
jgi:membrane fusion protein (multidrug efflux system)